MKLPTYHLKVDYEEFKAHTQVHPIFNETFLPSHLKELVKDKNMWTFQGAKYIMVLAGMKWILVKDSDLVKRD